MSNTRREFLHTTAALALGAASRIPASALAAYSRSVEQTTETGPENEKPQAAVAHGSEPTIQVPTIKFGGVDIGRLVLGVNPLYGFAHYNNNFSASMRDWYTQDRVCEVLHRANHFGINAYNFVNVARSQQDLARFETEGGKMHLIIQVMAKDDPAALVKDLKPLALQRRGEEIDKAFTSGKMADEREWCKRARDLGVLVGVGTHRPEVIELVEDQGWDIDFFSGCVYNRNRSPEEWRHVLNGELLEMPGDIYLQSDPARMYKVIRQTPKPCFAFKILAAGRVDDAHVAEAFRIAFSSIKPIDGVYVGMYPRIKDEVQINATLVHDILTASS